MIYKLHYWLYASGANVFSILIGVFVETYTDASPAELGTLLMIIPLLSMIFRPIICSMADRKRAHRRYLIICLLIVALSYTPFIIIPFLGETIYREHARTCWYLLMILKVIGDVAFGGVSSIGDSLTINYANRIGTSFTVYRVWGTISWMVFGIIIGQINEVEFLPKYVPGFMILILAALLDSLFIWLWPEEYFIMAEAKSSKPSDKNNELQQQEAKKENAFTKSLMPKEVVWAQAKGKLLCLITLGLYNPPTKSGSNDTNLVTIQVSDCSKDQVSSEENKINKPEEEDKRASDDSINKRTQLRILAILLRRDPRIVLYLMYFIFAGTSVASISFFFISLSDICHTQLTCDFSQLAGFLQVSMACLETILFIYIGRMIKLFGRLNMASLALFIVATKYTFYGTIWTQVSPYYSLLVEGSHGIIFGIYLTLMVDLGYLFSSEIQFIIPELLDKGIISPDTNADKLRFSLAATMQALISSAYDGFGRGLGAMIYGVLLERVSFETLWLLIGIAGFVCFTITVSINLIDRILGLRLGLDVRDKNREQQQLSVEKEKEPQSNKLEGP